MLVMHLLLKSLKIKLFLHWLKSKGKYFRTLLTTGEVLAKSQSC
jgi:hypothetical protein